MFEALTKAAVLGKVAFQNGIRRATALDPDVMPLIKGRNPREAMRIMDAWYKAWDKANLSSDE